LSSSPICLVLDHFHTFLILLALPIILGNTKIYPNTHRVMSHTKFRSNPPVGHPIPEHLSSALPTLLARQLHPITTPIYILRIDTDHQLDWSQVRLLR
jgi:hypothetical protein